MNIYKGHVVGVRLAAPQVLLLHIWKVLLEQGLQSSAVQRGKRWQKMSKACDIFCGRRLAFLAVVHLLSISSYKQYSVF